MIEKIFIANRVSGKNNFIFPDKIIIDRKNVSYYKSDLIGYKKLIINRADIASCYIIENILFSNIVIESKGGQKIVANGFLKSDAKEIIHLLT